MKRIETPLEKWRKKAKNGGDCSMCCRYVYLLTVDHIVPTSIIDCLDDSGFMKYNYEYNFQFLCKPCNNLKANKLDKSNPKTKNVLLVLLGFPIDKDQIII